MKRLLILFLFLYSSFLMFAQNDTSIRLPRFFAEGMVLQRGEKIPVWGWAPAGMQLEVTLNGKSAKTKVNADGTWKVYLPQMKAGGPYTMSIHAEDSHFSRGKGLAANLSLDNILIGDVFLCSGQSNMELPIRRCMDVVANEVKDYRNDQIRYVKFPHQFNYVRPNDNLMALPWQDITPENCAEVSGICYFMAQELQEKYKVPIGIINSAVGGTPVQAWMPKEKLQTFPEYTHEFEKAKYNQENWVDSVRRSETKASDDWHRKMIGSDPIVNQWQRPGYDFSSWQEVDMFSNWSQNHNGSYWFRTTVDLPADCAGQPALLRFGAIKDADSIFVNQQFVGNTTYEYPPRNYQVKSGILRAGTNEIVIHLMSQSGRPNFTRGKQYQLEVGGQIFPINDQIQMAVGSTMPPSPPSTYFVSGWTGLYNAMIAPLQDFPVKGMLWYQGESNMSDTQMYARLLTAMVDSWRNQFHRTFPVVIMQLPGYMATHQEPFESGWTQIRHQQYLAAQQIPFAALAPTFDSGEANDIHPQDKKTAGHRAALQMGRLAYGDKKTVSSGPMPESVVVKDGKALIHFAKNSGNLIVKGDKLRDFAILVNGKYQWAEAAIVDAHTVALTLPDNLVETTVRYGWDDFPHPSLFNEDGIPAPQFQISTEK